MSVTQRNYTGNGRDNNIMVTVGSLSLWFSYNTVIAFQETGKPKVIRQNEWSTTTGKHLNAIDPDHSKRISGEAFQKQLDKVMKSHKL